VPAQDLYVLLRTYCGPCFGQHQTHRRHRQALPIPAVGKKIAYDSRVAGFGCCAYASGARTFILNYRTRGRRERRITIGSFPDWNTTAARSEAAELKKTIDRGGDPLADVKATRGAPTVGELCDRFLKEYLPRKRPSTQHAYRLQIENEVRPALGRMKVAEVTFADTDGLHRKINARGTPYRANRVIALLQRMFAMAIKWQWRTDNPCRGIERNQEHKRRRYLTADELARLTKALAEHRDQQAANIIRLLLLTGARRGEVLAARWADFAAGFQTWSKPGAATKQKTEHQVPLSAPARQLLAELRPQVPADVEWVFPANGGGRHRGGVKDAWRSLCDAADIQGARVHDLRHTYASILASAGHGLKIIGELLGHTQPGTTDRYAHLFADPLRVATEQAGAILSGKPSAEIVPLKGTR
jgi:integrase